VQEGHRRKRACPTPASDRLRTGQAHFVVQHGGLAGDRRSARRRGLLREDHSGPVRGDVHGSVPVHAGTRREGAG